MNPKLLVLLHHADLGRNICHRCYFAVSITGYWAFGINVADNVLLTSALKDTVPNGLIIAADLFVVIHVIGSFQVYSMPVCTPPCTCSSPKRQVILMLVMLYRTGEEGLGDRSGSDIDEGDSVCVPWGLGIPLP